MHFKTKLNIIVLALAFLTSASMAVDGMGDYSVNLTINETLGTHLVNQTGFTLYYFMNDAPGNDISKCIGKCAEIWPPFYAETLTVANGLNAADFTSELRADGKKQTSYKGWPLYFYSKDMKPGDAYGHGFNKVWSVVDPSSPQFKQTSYPPASQEQSSYPSSSGGSSSGGY